MREAYFPPASPFKGQIQEFIEVLPKNPSSQPGFRRMRYWTRRLSQFQSRNHRDTRSDWTVGAGLRLPYAFFAPERFYGSLFCEHWAGLLRLCSSSSPDPYNCTDPPSRFRSLSLGCGYLSSLKTTFLLLLAGFSFIDIPLPLKGTLRPRGTHNVSVWQIFVFFRKYDS